MTVKRALILSVTLNALIIGYIVAKRIYFGGVNKMMASYSYSSNPQYSDQTSIYPAYKSTCELAFLGDSHIFRCHWHELLEMNTCNRGIGSDVMEGMFRRIGTVIASRPKVCFILGGANDIERYTPEDSTIYWYKKIVDTLRSAGIHPVIMKSTSVLGKYPNASRYNNRMEELNIKISRLTDTIGITTSPSDYQSDGLHLAAGGYLKWKNRIFQYLLKNN
jgi:hypothetical protein